LVTAHCSKLPQGWGGVQFCISAQQLAFMHVWQVCTSLQFKPHCGAIVPPAPTEPPTPGDEPPAAVAPPAPMPDPMLPPAPKKPPPVPALPLVGAPVRVPLPEQVMDCPAIESVQLWVNWLPLKVTVQVWEMPPSFNVCVAVLPFAVHAVASPVASVTVREQPLWITMTSAA
jgi:hypothetical protein